MLSVHAPAASTLLPGIGPGLSHSTETAEKPDAQTETPSESSATTLFIQQSVSYIVARNNIDRREEAKTKFSEDLLP
ncbi:hypothetical protein JZ751_016437 [Albula glossodonta]|uniref:Uncharacterized protein n=1 Tax=Albula glossodonta TaxID=121402 RepID=A0A8T2NPY6_9TELE|nr:hypothetical protein JZ751_016437 [Albula glossodonta]